MKRLTRDWFRKEIVSCAALAEINYDHNNRNDDAEIFRSVTNETLLSLPGRLAYCRILARCYGPQTDVFVNNRYLTTFFRR
ncbi:MAG: hypothetical protein J6K15_11125 [Lachnospiraceae bacterium]|nr:hypothetical protein [Lachnospiraceae bacterium]